MKLEDHESALNPDEFLEFSVAIRACSNAIGVVGNGDDFGMSAAEQDYRRRIRRHVVAMSDLPAGAVLTPADLMLKRTSATEAITDLQMAYGLVLRRRISKNSPILTSDFDRTATE